MEKTGEGIHHAMEGGKIAAEFLLEAIQAGNFSASAMKIYHERWMERFGNDFTWCAASSFALLHHHVAQTGNNNSHHPPSCAGR